MKNRITLFLFLIIGDAFAQTTSFKNAPLLGESSAKEQSMSSERLAKIDLMFKEAIDKDQIPSAVALVVRNGKIIFIMLMECRIILKITL